MEMQLRKKDADAVLRKEVEAEEEERSLGYNSPSSVQLLFGFCCTSGHKVCSRRKSRLMRQRLQERGWSGSIKNLLLSKQRK